MLLVRSLVSHLVAALSVSIASLSIASAQDGGSQPRIYPTFDERGVDLSDDVFTGSSPEISIGDAGAGGLSYSQTFQDNGWSHSVMGTVHAQTSTEYRVSLFGGTEVFTKSGSTYSPEQENGATLTYSGGNYTYTTGGGVVATFSSSKVGQTSFYGADEGVLTKVTFPNGEEWTYHYSSTNMVIQQGGWPEPIIVTYGPYYRLQSVTTNRGYQLHFEYRRASNVGSQSQLNDWRTVKTARLINNAVNYCSRTANTCSGLTENWPSLTMNYTSSNWSYTDNLGRVTHTYRNGSGRITGVRLPGSSSNDVSINYIGTSGVIQSMTVAGETWFYSYTDNGGTLVTTVTDPAGEVTRYEFEGDDGLLTAVENALGHRTTYQYNSDLRVSRVTAPEGNYTSFSYDGRGNMTEVRAVAKSGSGLADIVTTASYPSSCLNERTCNQPTSVTDPAGNTTNFTYAGTHGGMLTATAPAPSGSGDRPQTRVSYSAHYAWYKNASGQMVQASSAIYLPHQSAACSTGTSSSCAGTANEQRTNIAYGSSGVANNLQPTAVTAMAGNGTLSATSTLAYDAVGNILTVDGPLSGSADLTRTRYDDLRRVIGQVGPDPDGGGPLKHAASRTTYDSSGRVRMVEFGTVTSQSDAAWNNFARRDYQLVTYDNNHRVTHSRLIDGTGVTQALIQYSYDSAGRLDCTAQRINPSTFASPPSSACTLGTAGVYGPDRIARSSYDDLSRVTSVTTAYGTSAAAIEGVSTFTANGLLESLKDGNGNRTQYLRDGFDRLASIEYPHPSSPGSNTGNDDEIYTYDAYGRLASRRVRTNQLFQYSYDNLNRVTNVNAPSGQADTSYSYDLLSRVLTVTAAGQGTVTNAYDALGRRTAQTGANGTVSYQYNNLGQRTRMTWADGFYVTYDYNTLGAPTAIRENGAGSGVGVLAQFSYDDYGRRTSITRGNGVTTSYAFDAASRLDSLSQNLAGTSNDRTVSFDYNPAGQITSRTDSNDAFTWNGHVNMDLLYGHNGLNQITSVTSQPAPTYDGRGNMTDDGTRTFGYDYYNRLTSVSGGTTLSYDPLGRLAQTTGAATLNFQYDGLDLIAEYNGSGALQKRYVHGPGIDEPLVQYTGSGTSSREWLIADERGSIVAHTNGSGNATQINTYDEYGMPYSGNSGRFGYTGQVFLENTGLYHYKARAYHPGFGRFMQTDPIGQAGGLNIYAYVGGDPVNYTDPNGECGTPLSAVGGAIIGGVAAAGWEMFVTATSTGLADGRRATGRELLGAAVNGFIVGGAAGGVAGYTCNPQAAATTWRVTAGVLLVKGGADIVGAVGNRVISNGGPARYGTVSIVDISTYDPQNGWSPGIRLSRPGANDIAEGSVSIVDIPTQDPVTEARNGESGVGGGYGGWMVSFANRGAGGIRRDEGTVTIEDVD
tara:strand:- start:251843 stop:256078 length:4236 start_codon:yes stop_codon:yes gene_type:complete